MDSQKLNEQDLMALEMAKLHKRIAVLNAEKALVQNENAELNYKNIVLQLYMKYSLSPHDIINEDGTISKGEDTAK